jgi:hypothetical protein
MNKSLPYQLPELPAPTWALNQYPLRWGSHGMLQTFFFCIYFLIQLRTKNPRHSILFPFPCEIFSISFPRLVFILENLSIVCALPIFVVDFAHNIKAKQFKHTEPFMADRKSHKMKITRQWFPSEIETIAKRLAFFGPRSISGFLAPCVCLIPRQLEWWKIMNKLNRIAPRGITTWPTKMC